MITHHTKIRAVVFDIDGTLALMDKKTHTYCALPGAVDALNILRERNIPAVAYTNGTFFPPEHYYPQLADAGLNFKPGHILTPATVAAQQLKKLGVKRAMIIAADGTRVPIAAAGIELVEAHDGAPRVDAVVLGWTKAFNSAELEAAAQAIWGGAKLYATSVASHFAGSNGKLMGMSGAMAAAINNATGAKATVFGKPSTEGMDIIAELTGVAPAAMAVVGDDPKLEIEMARRADAFAIGVTCGVGNEAAFNAVAAEHRAHVVIPDLSTLFDHGWFE
jgi:4-nitrophenyl phosphatase